MIGKTISHYRILRKLGEGGMGVVYEAEDLKLKRNVALKFLPVHALDDSEQQERLVREAQAAAALEHININTVYEIGEYEGQTFMAMAFVGGDTLKQKIKAGTMSVADALSYAIQIAAGSARAHSQGIVHRDIKPANVMVTDEGIVKIVDFGLAKLAGATGLTKTDSTLGTAAYMSPEQAKGQKVDHRTDIWSLGVILYEMLARKLPFRGEHEAVVVYAILNEDVTPLQEVRPDIPEGVAQVVARALTKKPADRYASMDEMLVDLRILHSGSTPADVTGPVTSAMRIVRPPWWQNRGAMVAMAASALIVIFLGVMFALQGDESAPLETAMTEETAQSESSVETAPVVTTPALPEDSGWSMANDTTSFAVSVVPDSLSLPEDSLVPPTDSRIPTVAVLYLENLSGNEKEDYFAAGMTEDIIGGLSGIHSLRVLSRQDVKPYRTQLLGIREIGAALNADYVMEGSVRRDKETLRVSAQLVKVADGTLLWNQRFDRSPDNVFAVQAEIAAAIAEKMEVQFSVAERDNLARVPTTDLRAYDFYLQGRTFRNLRSKEDNANAEKYFRRALDRDRSFALAMIGLADVYLQRLDWGFDFNAKWMNEAAKVLESARHLDSTSAYFNRVLAIRYRLSGDFDRALMAARKAADIHPHDPYSHYAVGVAAVFAGKFAQARMPLEKALELKPDWAEPYRFLSLASRFTGRIAEAEHFTSRALELAPAAAHVRSFGGWFSLWQGEFEQAVIDFERAVTLKENTPSFRGNLGVAKLLIGETEEAIRLLKDAADDHSWQHLWSLGWAYKRQGKDKNARRAFANCRKACEEVLAVNSRDLDASYRVLWIDCLSGDVSDPTERLRELDNRDLFANERSTLPLHLAGIQTTIGNQAGAVALLGEVLKTKHYAAAYIAALPEFEALHNNSDFRKLVGLNESN